MELIRFESVRRAWSRPAAVPFLWGAAVLLVATIVLAVVGIITNLLLAIGLIVGAMILVVIASTTPESLVFPDAAGRSSVLPALAIFAALVGIGIGGVPGALLVALAFVGVTWLYWGGRSRMFSWQAVAIGAATLLPVLLEILVGASSGSALIRAGLAVAVVAVVVINARTLGGLAAVLAQGMSLYLALATILFLFGIRSGYTAVYVRLEEPSSFGPFPERWRLPMAMSWVDAPTVAAFCLALLVALLVQVRRGNRRDLIWQVPAALLSSVIVLASNGRVAVMVALVGAFLATGVIRRRATAVIVALAQVFWLAPFWWSLVFDGSGWPSVIVNAVVPQRGITGRSPLTLEGRTEIWAESISTWAHGSVARILFGWGPDGYATSGASDRYREVLGRAYVGDGPFPPHSVTLELLLGVGLIGLLLLAAVAGLIFVFGIRAIWRGDDGWRVIAAMLTLAALLSFTEVATLPSNGGPSLIVLAATAFSVWMFAGPAARGRVERVEATIE